MRSHPHLTKRLTSQEAQQQLAAFLKRTETQPHLHPDAQLSASGIRFAAQTGPAGGLQLHHLRRIEAGLRGESLIAETAEKLAQEFGGAEEQLPEGDDSRLDAAIDGKAPAGLKRKRSFEDIGHWAEESSEAVFGTPTRAGGPTTAADEESQDWQDKEEYELQQRDITGEVGEREGAPAVQQNGAPPVIKKATDGAGKAAKRAAKKERRNAEKVERAKERKANG